MVRADTPRARKSLTVVFDGDDTLWSTEPLYDRARCRAREAVSAAGLDGAAWEDLQRAIDVENVKTLGYSPARFPLSCVQAYARSCGAAARETQTAVIAAVQAAASSVFDATAPLLPAAATTLAVLAERGTRLALLTKGDLDVQNRRLAQSGLAAFFELTRVVDEKTPAVIAQLVSELHADVGDTWMIGNSLRSDILPALDAGLRAIWIDAHVWEHERSSGGQSDPRIVKLTSLSEVAASLRLSSRTRRLRQAG